MRYVLGSFLSGSITVTSLAVSKADILWGFQILALIAGIFGSVCVPFILSRAGQKRRDAERKRKRGDEWAD